MFRLQPGTAYHSNRGVVPHDEMIGSPDGVRLRTAMGRPVLVQRPTLEDYIMEMPRKTQIIYPKDLGLILTRGNIFPGARVLQSGLGSGSLACFLMRYLGRDGKLISYENRPEFIRLAQRNIAAFLGYEPDNHRVDLRDAYDGFVDTDLDTVFLDLPEPERCVGSAADALRDGGMVLAWLPTTMQVHRLVVAMRAEPRLEQVDAMELLLRPWYVTEESMRPVHRMVAHTGFLVSARRCQPRPIPAAPPPPADEPAADAAEAVEGFEPDVEGT